MGDNPKKIRDEICNQFSNDNASNCAILRCIHDINLNAIDVGPSWLLAGPQKTCKFEKKKVGYLFPCQNHLMVRQVKDDHVQVI